MTTLPDLPSALIRVALTDLRRCEQDDKYFVTMALWHVPGRQHGQPCSVCLAGAVMAKSLRVSHLDTSSNLFETGSDDMKNKLYALNYLRTGCVSLALETLQIAEPGEGNLLGVISTRIVPYAEDKELFVTQMNTLADDLEKVGL